MAEDWIAYIAKHRIHATTLIVVLLIAWRAIVGAQHSDALSVGLHHSFIGLALVIGGLALRTWAAGTLRKNLGLTTTGPYSLIRNPLYVGTFMMVVGFTIFADAPAPVWVASAICLVLCVAAVLHEERVLSNHFGSSWQQYAQATPRFIPKRLFVLGSTWTIEEWIRNREYQAVAATMAGLIAIGVWNAI